MKVRELLQIPFFRRCRFVSTHSVSPFSDNDMLSVEDEIEDIEGFVCCDEPFSVVVGARSLLVPNYITYVICRVKQEVR